MFEIEKQVPIPTSGKYPFEKMGIGDSFYVKGNKQIISAARAASRAYVIKSANGSCQPVFLSRTDEDGVRIWRTK